MHHFPPPPADASLTERFAWLVKTIVMRVELFVRWEPATEPVRDAIKVRLRRARDPGRTPPRARPGRRAGQGRGCPAIWDGCWN
jgi:hypothetical protein